MSVREGRPDLAPRTMVDHYRVVRLLGQGGFGEVYLARDVRLGRKVALKVIHPRHLGSADAIKRFLFEVKATARFSHPNIVTVYAVGEHGGSPYVALEYLEGQNLRERLAERALTAMEAIRGGQAVARALREAHRHRIVHRDLKPENILIPHDGRPRVVDFGLARRSAAPGERAADLASGQRSTSSVPAPAQAPAMTTLPPLEREDDEASADTVATPSGHQPPVAIANTVDVRQGGEDRAPALDSKTIGEFTLADSATSGAIQGTPLYMAPEQWRGEPSSSATDVWALGVLLYEMLAGAQPYRERQAAAQAELVCGDDPAPPLPAETKAPQELAELIAACLLKDAQARVTIDTACETLERLLAGRGVQITEAQGPFRGLLPFGEQHAAMYFGREDEIAAFLEQLRAEATLAVVGPSGAGKSSFVRAGVVARLREQGHHTVLRLRPGADPFRALAASLRRGGASTRRSPDSGDISKPYASAGSQSFPDERTLAGELQQTPERLALRLRQIAEDQGARVLLVIDQLEELHTHVEDAEQRAAFMRALATAADDADEPVRLVLTLRDDFLGRLAEGESARRLLGRVVILRAPDRQTLGQILQRPLEACCYTFDDPSLVQEMIEAVAEEPACLPLLQFTAQQLWERRDKQARQLTRASYQAMGGVAGALANHADSVLEGLPPAELDLAREIFLRLVTPEGTRRVIGRADLLEGLDDRAQQVLDRLTAARLLSARRGATEQDATVDLAHEALINGWRRLAQWLEVSHEERAFIAEADQAATLWERRGSRTDEVWQAEALADGLRALERCASPIPDRVRRFLRAGAQQRELAHRRDQRRRSTRRRLLAFGASAITLVVIAVTVAWLRSLSAEKRRTMTLLAQALREGADRISGRGDLASSRAMLRRSLELRDSFRARTLYWSQRQKVRVWSYDLAVQITDIAVSPDFSRFAIASSRGKLYLMRVRTRRVEVLAGAPRGTTAAAFSPSGRRLAVGANNGVIGVFDTETRRWKTIKVKVKAINQVAFLGDEQTIVAHDGRRVFELRVDGQIRRQASFGGAPIARIGVYRGRLRVAFGDQRIAITDDPFTTKRPRVTLSKVTRYGFPVVFDAAAERIAVHSLLKHTVSVFDLRRVDSRQSLQPRSTLPAGQMVAAIRFGRGATIAIGTADGLISIGGSTPRPISVTTSAWISRPSPSPIVS